MAELIFKSAGVSSREIDLSFPTQAAPVGVPAGVIGTSNEGPAFVPVTVSNFTEFQNIFGASDGSKFGPLAVSQWLKNAQSCTFVRVLGAGDGKKKATTGVVNRAGFFVGDQIIQNDGNVLGNTFAYSEVDQPQIKGRTYFLGCFMSESAGSTIFSSAGLQASDVAATATITAVSTTMTEYDGGTFTITDSNNLTKIYLFDDDNDGATGTVDGSGNVRVQIQGKSTADHVATEIKSAIESANGHNGSITVSSVSSGAITLTQGQATSGGNNRITRATITSDSVYTISGFSGGSGTAIPILRGVVLAPSGVVIHLGTHGQQQQPSSTETAIASSHSVTGRKGYYTGSVDTSNENFIMLLNGHKNTSTYPNVITASFKKTSPNYLATKLNTDPDKFEQSGHLLYSYYDVAPAYANVTGSGIIRSGWTSVAGASYEDVGFILTSSLSRGTTSPTATVPLYEDFRDRFKYASSPYIVSQSPVTNLFKIHALSAGAKSNTRYKISIENITRINASTYPTFDLIVRDFKDSDEKKVVLESFRGLSLNPESDRYIARVIGDMHTFFDFDNDTLSQKINITGNHPVKSRYIRVEVTDDLNNGVVTKTAIPFGFRGPLQVVSSGSILTNPYDSTIHTLPDSHRAVIQPPIPLRQTIALSTGTKKRVASKLYWGMQFNNSDTVAEPNKPSLFNESFNSYTKFFPSHRTDGRNFYEASDTIGYNLFSLEHIRVRTGSAGTNGDNLPADVEQWHSASYVRNASLNLDAKNMTDKTRYFRASDLETPGNRRFAKFSFFLQGGWDGTDIFNIDKRDLNNNAIRREVDNESDQGGVNGPTAAAYRKAIDVMGVKSEVDIKLLAIPGIRVPSVTDYAITAIENRFDALYLMDIEQVNSSNKVMTGSSDLVDVKNTVQRFKNRGLDSSFAAAYFPDVVLRDPTTDNLVVAPSTAAVLGAFSLNDAIAHPWFAPAGFTRGALSAVEGANVRLSRKNLDDLYDVDINPLTSFPGTGVVVYGQKTLQANASALDRINVRRLLINVRRSVRQVANSLLFEPNRQETLDKFNSLVNPILQRVQEQGGVDRYRVIIDTSTTTQADVENNTIRGKIFLQPTRTVEFIALDFVVTNAGANI